MKLSSNQISFVVLVPLLACVSLAPDANSSETNKSVLLSSYQSETDHTLIEPPSAPSRGEVATSIHALGANSEARMPAAATPTVGDREVWNDNCENFIRSDGTFGPWGQYVSQTVGLQHPELLRGGFVDMDPMCPAYDSFDIKQRREFWVYYFASMAMVESSCTPKVFNPKATMGVGAGLFQLNLSKKDCDGYSPADYNDPMKNIACAIDKVATDISASGALFSDGTHFAATRFIGGRKTQLLVNQYADCQAEPGKIDAPDWGPRGIQNASSRTRAYRTPVRGRVSQ